MSFLLSKAPPPSSSRLDTSSPRAAPPAASRSIECRRNRPCLPRKTIPKQLETRPFAAVSEPKRPQNDLKTRCLSPSSPWPGRRRCSAPPPCYLASCPAPPPSSSPGEIPPQTDENSPKIHRSPIFSHGNGVKKAPRLRRGLPPSPLRRRLRLRRGGLRQGLLLGRLPLRRLLGSLSTARTAS